MEVSVVILIIGLLLIGVIGAKHMLKKARITSAHSLTKASPINAIKSNAIWLESSFDELNLGKNLSSEDALTSWRNSANTQNSYTISAVGTGPVYYNSINYIQAVKFGTTSSENHLQIDNPEFLNNTDYTIIITEQRIASNDGGNYLLSDNDSFAIGYESETSIIQTHGEDASENNQTNVESLSSYSNKPRIITVTHSSADGNKIYINGTLANEDISDDAKTHLTNLSSTNKLKIGKNYNGEIGEIAIFDQALKNVEIRDIENYMSEKWNSPINRNSSPTCTEGIVTSSGCSQSCSISITGSTSSPTVADGVSDSLTCNVTGYTGTASYSCSGGTATTGTCGCDAGSGYVLVGGACTEPSDSCNYNIAGATIPTGTVDAGSRTIACNSSDNFAGTNFSYTCADNVAITGNCTCTEGYAYDSETQTCVEAATGISCTSDYEVSSGLHVFTGVGTHTLDCTGGTAGTVEVLVVAGGGGGGGGGNGGRGSGGGAGGLILNSSFAINAETITVTVGAGGAGGAVAYTTAGAGLKGGNSSFSSLTAIGGGGGSGREDSTAPGGSGGSGGGGGISGNSKNGGSGTSGQGNSGGANWPGGPNYGAGGGGGAGEPGQRGSSTKGGDGGDGIEYPTGSGVYYAGGGAGSYYSNGGSNGFGGLGGGGNVGSPGTPNTGGGGGGANTASSTGNAGGSGMVIVKYISGPPTSY